MSISNDDTEYLLSDSVTYFENKETAVQFVADHFDQSDADHMLIITIRPGKFGGFSVGTATIEWSDDIRIPHFSDLPQTT